jgi:hypothetical protein
MIILIASLFSNYAIIQQPAYSQEDTTPSSSTTSTSKDTNDNNEGGLVLLLIIISIIYLIYRKYKQRYGKHRIRRSFPQSVREETKRRQHYKCAICKRSTGLWDFDHRDGNRTNNRSNNCQALCPNCHARKTRGLLPRQKNRFSVSWPVVVGIIILIIIFIYSK